MALVANHAVGAHACITNLRPEYRAGGGGRGDDDATEASSQAPRRKTHDDDAGGDDDQDGDNGDRMAPTTATHGTLSTPLRR